MIFTKDQLLAPLREGMLAPPHPMAAGATDTDYYQGKVTRYDASQALAVSAQRDASSGVAEAPSAPSAKSAQGTKGEA